MKNRVCSYEEMNNICSQLDMVQLDSGHVIADGFYYLSFSNIYYPNLYNLKENQKLPIFLCSFDEDILVGVMKVSYYPSDFGGFYAINYVDVRKDYKRLGIATSLYTLLNDWLKDTDIIVGTDLSREGETCNLNHLRNRLISSCLSFNNESEYFRYFNQKEKELSLR